MSAIQELAPYFSTYQRNIKRAKEDQHYTIDRLVEESGSFQIGCDEALRRNTARPETVQFCRAMPRSRSVAG